MTMEGKPSPDPTGAVGDRSRSRREGGRSGKEDDEDEEEEEKNGAGQVRRGKNRARGKSPRDRTPIILFSGIRAKDLFF
jgi:hypothetical protein